MSFRFSSFSRVSPERLGRALASCEKNLVEPEVPPGMVVKNSKEGSMIQYIVLVPDIYHETSRDIIKHHET